MGQGIRQSDTANYLSPASTLDANADYTLMGWFRFATFEDVYSTPMLLTNEDDSRYDAGYMYADWRGVQVFTGDIVEDGGAFSSPLDTWIHAALVRDGADLNLWIDGVQTFTATLDVSEADPVTKLALGGWPGYDGYSVLGDIAACRAWSAALSGTEIAAEMASATAVRSSALWADWQMVGADETARLADSSGNARHLTRYGAATGTFEDGPEFADNTDELEALDAATGAPAADSPTLGQEHALLALVAVTGAPTAGTPLLVFVLRTTTPGERTIAVPADRRTASVPAAGRTIAVAAQSRTIQVPKRG